MPDVTMPDGTIVANVPDTPEARQQLSSAWQAKVASGAAKVPSATPAADALNSAIAARKGLPLSQLMTRNDNIAGLQDAADAEAAQASNAKDAKEWEEVKDKPLLDRLPFYAKLGGSAILRGLASLGGAAGDAGLALQAKPPSMAVAQPGAGAQAVSSIGTQPQTGLQRYASAGTQGVTAALASPAVALAPIRAAIAGGTSGLSAQAAGEATKDQSPEIQALAQTLAGIAGGAVAHVATMPKTTQSALVQTAVRDTNPAELQAARDRMQAVQDSGQGSINASQAMTQPSGIDKLVEVLANSKNGPKVQAQLRAQPSQVAVAAEDALGTLPGQLVSPVDAANAVQSSADSSIQAAKDLRSGAWSDIVKEQTEPVIQAAKDNLSSAAQAAAQREQEFSENFPGSPRKFGYIGRDGEEAGFNELRAKQANLQVAQDNMQTAGQVPPQLVSAEIARLGKLSSSVPNTAEAGEMGSLASRLQGSDGKPLTDPYQINKVLTDYTTALKTPTLGMKGVDSGLIKYMGSQVAQIRQNLGEGFAPIRSANDAFETLTNSVVNPLKKSVVGRMAGLSGADDAKEATVSKLQSLFDKGTVPGSQSVSDILTLERGIRNVPGGPQAYQDAVKTWVGGKISNALSSEDNRTPETVASSLTKIFGDPDQSTTQSQGTKDMLAGLARSKGMAPDQAASLVNGFQKMQRFAAAASRRPGSVGDSTGDLNEAAAGGSQEGLRDNVSSALFGVRRAISNLRSGDALRFADRLVTTPEGMDILIRMAREPAMSQGTANAISTLAATRATQSPGN